MLSFKSKLMTLGFLGFSVLTGHCQAAEPVHCDPGSSLVQACSLGIKEILVCKDSSNKYRLKMGMSEQELDINVPVTMAPGFFEAYENGYYVELKKSKLTKSWALTVVSQSITMSKDCVSSN